MARPIESKKYTPLPDIRHERIRIVPNFPPFVDQSKIGIDISRIQTLMRLGGITSIRLVGQTDQETSSFVPNIVGASPNGEALAARTGLKTKAQTHSVTSSSDSLAPRHASTWINLNIDLNIKEISHKIASDKKLTRGARMVEPGLFTSTKLSSSQSAAKDQITYYTVPNQTKRELPFFRQFTTTY